MKFCSKCGKDQYYYRRTEEGNEKYTERDLTTIHGTIICKECWSDIKYKEQVGDSL